MRVTLFQFPALAILSWSVMQAHELAHHVVGRGIAGAWGTMTFNEFSLARAMRRPHLAWVATAAGPLLTYALLACGTAMILSDRRVASGVLLVCANLPLARIVTAFGGRGDEAALAARFGVQRPRRAAVFATTAFAGAPLALALARVESSQRYWALPALALGPMLVDGVAKFAVLEPLLRTSMGKMKVFGIPVFLLCVDAVVIALLPLAEMLAVRVS